MLLVANNGPSLKLERQEDASELRMQACVLDGVIKVQKVWGDFRLGQGPPKPSIYALITVYHSVALSEYGKYSHSLI
jgi:hypothetical protein